MAVATHPLTPERYADLLAFFAGNGEFNWCWCTYWDFRGDNRQWIRREEGENRRLREERLADGGLQGVLLYDAGGTAAGWCRLDRRRDGDKLAEFYGPAPDGTLAVTCFCVPQDARGQGYAHTLLAAAIDQARALGAVRLEGFPRPDSAPDAGARLPDGEVWTGPAAVFTAAGFTLTRQGAHRCIAALEL